MSKINTKITKTNNSHAIFRKGVLLLIILAFGYGYGIANAENKNIRVTNADEWGSIIVFNEVELRTISVEELGEKYLQEIEVDNVGVGNGYGF